MTKMPPMSGKTCGGCRGTGKAANTAVSAAMLTVTGVRTRVHRPCPTCAGGAVLLR